MRHLPTLLTRSPGRWAFSMIEVMIALAVLATVMTILASNLYTLSNVRTTMKERAVAQEIARLMSERIQSQVFASLGGSGTEMGWSQHRRLTPAPGSTVPTNPMTETATNPADNLIAQGLLQQPSEIAGLSVFLEYYRQSLVETMATSPNPSQVWQEVTTATGAFAGDTTHLCPDLDPIQDARDNPGEFVIMRVIVRWNPRIGGTQQVEFTVAKKE
jgi:type II secretory pathway pseudopilin PulG